SPSHLSTLSLHDALPILPTTLPQKLYDSELLDILESAEKVWIQTHFNHPREVTPEVARVCKSLLTRGMPLNNHTVLMKGVNDDRSEEHTSELQSRENLVC